MIEYYADILGWRGRRIYEGGGKGDAPDPPDYTGAAQAQSAASKEIATQQTHANRPTLNTPWGQMAWSSGAGVDPSTGQPVTNWTGNLNLTQDQQAALNAQQRIQAGRSQAAETLLPQSIANLQQGFNWGGMPQLAATPQAQLSGSNNGMITSVLNQYGLDLSAPNQTTQSTNEPAFAQQRNQIQNALFEQMRPEHQRQEDATRTRLANMGLSAGGEAYNRELERLQGTQASERFNAMQTAGQEQQRLQQMLMGQQQQAFGQDLSAQQAQNAAMMSQFGQGLQAGQFGNQAGAQAFGQNLAANQQNFNQMMGASQYQNQLRQQAIAEEAQRRGMNLNELNALLTGQQVNMPQMPNFMGASAGEAPNLLGAAQAQGQYNLNAANMNTGPDIGSLIGTGAQVAGAMGMFSDARLKSNIVRIGTHARGIGLYIYTIFGRREVGVLAQELLRVAPHLVGMRDGYFTVDYGGL